jgi:TnpA family transposase
MLRKLGSYPRQNGLAVALRELGRIERTLFTLEWLQNVELHDRGFENQRHRASGLNLVVAAIALWNTAYLERAVNALRAHGHPVDDDLLQHLSPLGWDHINLTGDYTWKAHRSVERGRFRALRPLASA